jgi:adenine-specific DNA-methyltransferase
MSANFAIGLKKYLLDRNLLHALVTFSNCSNIFSDALTTASVVLIEKSEKPTEKVCSYYLRSIDSEGAPQSLKELQLMCNAKTVDYITMRKARKWEPILRGDISEIPEGWTTLGEVVFTKRGIATGANSFFLINENVRTQAEIDQAHVLPCIGGSSNVKGLLFTNEDFNFLSKRQARVWLLNFSTNLSDGEKKYIQYGEKQKLQKRYITKTRNPWFSMEKRAPAPIWGGVFGRGDLRFIYNDAGVRSLTNFHSIYPKIEGSSFAKALVAILNSRIVRDYMVSHQRGYGGGLMKFEPKDLLAIPIPDLRTLSKQSIIELAAQLPLMHSRQCKGLDPCTGRIAEIISSQNTHLSQEFRLDG